jgi:hypothetical protein
VAQNPDPNLSLTSITGVTRTLDDWLTVFHLAAVMVPPRLEAKAFNPVIERIFATLGDADVRATIWVAGPESMARKILGDLADRYLVLCDPDQGLATSLGLERLPAFVHLRQDTTLVAAAQGWSPSEWQKVADGIAKAQHWTSPVLSGIKRCPPATPGWALTA